jgi:hypothetical protein
MKQAAGTNTLAAIVWFGYAKVGLPLKDKQHDGGEYMDDIKRTPRYVTLWEQQKAAALT